MVCNSLFLKKIRRTYMHTPYAFKRGGPCPAPGGFHPAPGRGSASALRRALPCTRRVPPCTWARLCLCTPAGAARRPAKVPPLHSGRHRTIASVHTEGQAASVRCLLCATSHEAAERARTQRRLCGDRRHRTRSVRWKRRSRIEQGRRSRPARSSRRKGGLWLSIISASRLASVMVRSPPWPRQPTGRA